MADDQLDADQIIEPTEQRSVALLDADEVLAARADADIYLPIRPICAALGLSYSGFQAQTAGFFDTLALGCAWN